MKKPERYKGLDVDQYASLRLTLSEAANQAEFGKGKERHDKKGEKFENQQICEIARRLSESKVGGPLFQAVKKVYESSCLPPAAEIEELKGAINYIAAAIIVLQEEKDA